MDGFNAVELKAVGSGRQWCGVSFVLSKGGGQAKELVNLTDISQID